MAARPGDLAELHAILGFPIMAFLPFLLLKYHNAEVSAFDDNNIMILAFFVATLTYVAAIVILFKLRSRDVDCPAIISNIGYLSAPLAVISLVMITFPYLGWFLFVIWIGFLVKLALDSYEELFELFEGLGNKARSASDLTWNKLSLIWNKLSRREAKNDDQQSSAITSDSIV